MKNKTWVKICSVALSLIMSLSMVGGLFVSAESAVTVDDSDFVVVDGKNPVTDKAVGATTTAKTTAGTTTTTPNVNGVTYDTWDGTYDTEWEAVEGKENAYYISSAEELFGLQKMSKEIGWQGTVDKINAGVAQYNADLDTYLAGESETAPAFPFNDGTYITGAYVYHAYSGYTFYVTANVDMTGHEWNGLGSCSGSAGLFGFDGDIYGWDKETNTAKSVYIKGMNLVPSVDATELVLNYKTADGADATVTLSGGKERVGFISTHSGSKVENLTFVAPTATVATGTTGFVVGGGRTEPSSYKNVHVVDGVLTFPEAYGDVGGFIGGTDTANTYTNCSSDLTIDYTFSGVKLNKYAHGGFAGKLMGKNTIKDCYVNLTVNESAAGIQTLGGFVGQVGTNANKAAAANLTNCKADLNVTMAVGGECLSGGLVGWVNDQKSVMTIDGCVVDGTWATVGTNGSSQGGLVGSANRGNATLTIKNSYCSLDMNMGALAGFQQIAGIIGCANTKLTIDGCVYDGTMTLGAKVWGVAGIVGSNNNATFTEMTIKNTSFEGKITSTADIEGVAGFYGYINNKNGKAVITYNSILNIENCTSAGVIESTRVVYRAGGVFGSSNAAGGNVTINIKNTYSNTTIRSTGGEVKACSPLVAELRNAYNTLTITGCAVEANMTASGTMTNNGGLLGLNNAASTVSISDSVYNGTMSATAVATSGGIIGRTIGKTTVTNCAAKAHLDASRGAYSASAWATDAFGAIIGYTKANASNPVAISGCVAVVTNADTEGRSRNIGMVVGKSEGGGAHTMTNTIAYGDLAYTGMTEAVGGVLGLLQSGSIKISGCYYGGRMDLQNGANSNKQTGGFIGCVNSGTTATVENSQMEGVISTKSTQTGAIVGRFQSGTSAPTLNIENVVISGIAAGSNGYQVVGLAASNGTTTGKAILNYTNVYSQISLPVVPVSDFANIEASDNGTPDDTTDDIKEDKDNVTLTINGGSPVINESSDHFAAEVTDVIADADFSESTVWADDGDATPVLATAADADRLWASADITWFDPAALLEEDFYFENEDQVYGYAMLSNLDKFRSAFVGKEFKYVAKTDCLVENVVADKAFYEGAELVPTHYCAHNDETGEHGKAIPMATLDVQYQIGKKIQNETQVWDPDFEEWVPGYTYGYNIRVLAAVTDTTGYDSVGFLVTFNGETVRLTTHEVYASVIGTSSDIGLSDYTANGVFGDEAEFMFATTFLNMPENDEFTIQAFAVVNGIEKTGAAETWTVSGLVAAAN